MINMSKTTAIKEQMESIGDTLEGLPPEISNPVYTQLSAVLEGYIQCLAAVNAYAEK